MTGCVAGYAQYKAGHGRVYGRAPQGMAGRDRVWQCGPGWGDVYGRVYDRVLHGVNKAGYDRVWVWQGVWQGTTGCEYGRV